tara:strand:- start:4984 stop:7827 length:2844 start_codon:yes stop_codon:yes gene_type:complete
MRRIFLNLALRGEGHYCLFGARPADKKLLQQFYTSIEDLVVAADGLDAEGYDAYFALATFSKNVSRRVDNIDTLSSFFLDLDCGDGKDFLNREEAILKLRRFCGEYKLPKPTMVNSGRGIHVYWFLSNPIVYSKWFPVADRLKKLCVKSGFNADPSVTSDGARVLRVPGTHNYKTNPPSNVHFLGVGEEIKTIDLESFSVLLGVDNLMPVTTAYTPSESNQTMQMLMGNRESFFKTILLKTSKGHGCSQLSYIITNQDTMSEPMWRAGLSIAKFCADGEKAVHLISHKHPDYTATETARKVNNIRGPYTCVKFDEFRPDTCINCPNWGHIKSPITLGNTLREAEVDSGGNYVVDSNVIEQIVEAPALTLPNNPITPYIIPKYPHPYVRGANGGVYIKTRDDNGDVTEECIYHNDLYVVKRVRDAEAGESAVMRLHLPKDGVREFTLPMSAVTSKEEFRKALSAQGVALMKMDNLMTYTTNWVNELQSSSKSDEAHRHFGWTNDKLEAFILGNQKITANSIEFNPPSNATVTMFPAFEPKGTLQAWKDTFQLWNADKFVLQQFALGMGFGSALMELMNVNCGTVSFYHKDSGVGKTALLIAQAGIWGDPQALVLQKEDTYNFKMNRSEVYHSIIMPIDEITNMNPKQMSDMVYQATGGQQRGRMSASSNVERHRSSRWSLLTSFTANTSVVERISMAKAMPKAEAQRVLECRVDRLFDKTTDKVITDAFEAGLLDNYGHAGVPFVQYVMRNVEGCRKLVTDIQKRVDNIGKLTSENRFWSATIGATIAGLIIAKKAGLHDFDTQKVFKWAVTDLLDQNKRNMDEMNGTVFDIMDDFFAENISYILQIKSTVDNRGQNDNGLDALVIPEQVARGKLIARYETDTKLFFVKPKPLKEWCGNLQINYAHLITEIMEQCGGKNRKVRLTKGTNLQLPASDVIVMKFDVDPDE